MTRQFQHNFTTMNEMKRYVAGFFSSSKGDVKLTRRGRVKITYDQPESGRDLLEFIHRVGGCRGWIRERKKEGAEVQLVLYDDDAIAHIEEVLNGRVFPGKQRQLDCVTQYWARQS